MKISVTQEDIDSGVKNSSCFCPIAYAAMRIVPAVTVSRHTIKLLLKSYGWNSYSLPEAAKKFVHDFDDGKSVVPFEFELS